MPLRNFLPPLFPFIRTSRGWATPRRFYFCLVNFTVCFLFAAFASASATSAHAIVGASEQWLLFSAGDT